MFYSKKLKLDYSENQTIIQYPLYSSTNTISNPDTDRALFLQARYWTKNNYSLSVGARYQEIKKDFSRDLLSFLSKDQSSSTKKWKYLTPTLSFLYYGEKNYNAYATFTRGYRPGGFNYRGENNVLTSYKEEETNSYEIGYKYNSKKYIFESALFYNDIKNLRVNTLLDNFTSVVLNAEKAYSYGIESKVNYKINNFNIVSTLGLIEARIKRLTSNTNTENKKIIDVPNTTASLGFKYTFNRNIYIQSNINHVGKKYYNVANTKSLESYETVNAGLGYKEKNFNILFYANNIFDKKYNDFMIATTSNEYYHFGKPRVIGVNLSLHF